MCSWNDIDTRETAEQAIHAAQAEPEKANDRTTTSLSRASFAKLAGVRTFRLQKVPSQIPQACPQRRVMRESLRLRRAHGA